MFLNKLKTSVPLALLVVGLLACVTVAAVPPSTPPVPPPDTTTKPFVLVARHVDPPAAKVEPKPLPKGPNKLLFFKTGEFYLIDPDGKNEKKVIDLKDNFPEGMSSIYMGRLSPDGKTIAVLLLPKPEPGVKNYSTSNAKMKLYLKDLSKSGGWTDLDVVCKSFIWSPVGNLIVTTDWTPTPDKAIDPVHHLVDVKTKEKKGLKLPDDHKINDWTPDGKYLLTTSTFTKDEKEMHRLHEMNLDGSEHKVVTEHNLSLWKLSPDGTRVLCTQRPPRPKDKEEKKIPPSGGKGPPPPFRPEHVDYFVLDIATGKTTPVADVPLNASVQDMCWSPDGKQLAYTWRQVHEDFQPMPGAGAFKDTESHLIICDVDGKNQKTIVTVKAVMPGQFVMAFVDWR